MFRRDTHDDSSKKKLGHVDGQRRYDINQD